MFVVKILREWMCEVGDEKHNFHEIQFSPKCFSQLSMIHIHLHILDAENNKSKFNQNSRQQNPAVVKK